MLNEYGSVLHVRFYHCREVRYAFFYLVGGPPCGVYNFLVLGRCLSFVFVGSCLVTVDRVSDQGAFFRHFLLAKECFL